MGSGEMLKDGDGSGGGGGGGKLGVGGGGRAGRGGGPPFAPGPPAPPGRLRQSVPSTWSISWSSAPHRPRMASTPAGPRDCTKMFAQWLGVPCEYPTLW